MMLALLTLLVTVAKIMSNYSEGAVSKKGPFVKKGHLEESAARVDQP